MEADLEIKGKDVLLFVSGRYARKDQENRRAEDTMKSRVKGSKIRERRWGRRDSQVQECALVYQSMTVESIMLLSNKGREGGARRDAVNRSDVDN
jgi:hypothetical protein